ncbi:tetratricopeptide repeat protein [Idiomarina aminovorans]|uniref:tetratricopeptide repeat protein n=1 Tax=Idiomarina aminovorans TaxID=2914829 RepID=UPI0020046742|nr:CDC27 family protein [Idiomarina sp. ATCH4]MCK7459479.1 tetratricopeptide repeat protein [Idiomarina sp. ATCH4]
MKLKFIALAVCGCWLAFAHPVLAQQTERVPALREKVYGQLARAQEQADNGNLAEGLSILSDVAEKADSMNSYERAMMWNFYGFMHYEQGNTKQAINYFEKVVKESPIPESLQKSTLFSLAQLALSDGQFKRAIAFLGQWESLAEKTELSQAWVLKAQANYQAGDHRAALPLIDKAIAAADARQKTPDENWLILKRALHYELEQPKQVAKVMERLVADYSKPEYWLQLAGVYAQLEQDEKQLAVLEAAHQQSFVKKGSEWRQLAQAYYFNELPYKAAETMQEAIANGKVDASVDNLKFVAQAYTQAKEYEKAIGVYKKASARVEHGKFAAQIAQLYLTLDNNEKAVEYAKQALTKGDLDNEGNLYLAEGMALLNLKRYEQAVESFEQAGGREATQRQAKQWLKYAKSQHKQQQQMAKLQ